MGAALLGLFAGLAGDHDRAREHLGSLEERSKTQPVRPFHFAIVHAGLGEYDRATECFEQAFEERDTSVAYLHLEPLLDPLRAHARFQALLRRMNFPETADDR